MELKKEIVSKLEEVVNKIKSDKNFASSFKKDPAKAIESVTGIDLPDDQVNAAVKLIESKIDADKVMDVVGNLFGKK